MNNDKFIRLETLREVEIAFHGAKQEGFIIPAVVFEILEVLKKEPYQELPPEVINEQIEHGND
jgi:hypothetical protein